MNLKAPSCLLCLARQRSATFSDDVRCCGFTDDVMRWLSRWRHLFGVGCRSRQVQQHSVIPRQVLISSVESNIFKIERFKIASTDWSTPIIRWETAGRISHTRLHCWYLSIPKKNIPNKHFQKLIRKSCHFQATLSEKIPQFFSGIVLRKIQNFEHRLKHSYYTVRNSR